MRMLYYLMVVFLLVLTASGTAQDIIEREQGLNLSEPQVSGTTWEWRCTLVDNETGCVIYWVIGNPGSFSHLESNKFWAARSPLLKTNISAGNGEYVQISKTYSQDGGFYGAIYRCIDRFGIIWYRLMSEEVAVGA